MPRSERQSRRRFLAITPAALFAALVAPRSVSGLLGRGRAGEHPEPRPGIDASKVLEADELANELAGPVYDQIREIPEIADGIGCYCACAELPEYRSLLTCYEDGGMAQWCDICQGQAKLAHSLHEGGNTLAQIRTAIDALYG